MSHFFRRQAITAERYGQAVGALVSALDKGVQKTGVGASLLVYGSYCKNRAIPGISDIDAIVLVHSPFHIPQEFSRTVNKEFATFYVSHKFVPDLDITVIDSGHMGDGRFMSYSETLSAVFSSPEQSTIVYGEDFRDSLQLVRLFDSCEARLAFNLEKLRKYLLLFQNTSSPDAEMHTRLNSFQYIRRIGVKTATLLDKEDLEKEASVLYLEQHFPDIDFSPLKKVNSSFKSTGSVMELVAHREKSTALLYSSLAMYESLLKSIVEQYPMRSVIQNRSLH